MNTRKPIEIVQTRNGYMVQLAPFYGRTTNEEGLYCFETLGGLLKFLEKYYMEEGDFFVVNPQVREQD